jgi:outer membrane immunogenic protein
MNLKLAGAATAALALIATSFSAEAADIPRPVYKGPAKSVVAYYNWTGFYAGIMGGYGSGTSYFAGSAAAGNTSEPFKVTGGFIGGTLGYNYQIGSVVWGIEGDLAYAMMRGSNVALPPCPSCEVENRYFGTIRGRLGYAFDRFLPYFTGGLAFASLRVNNPTLATSQTFNRTGYTLGAGIEYAFLGNWSAKIEYLYNDYGMPICAAATCGFDLGTRYFDRVLKFGVNYKFSGPIFSRW